ncbi:MAG: putative virulence-associated protein [Pseudomonadota bacterium]|jgi:virulence-associated protein VapD
MYAIAFDLVVSETNKYHPKGVSQAYNDIAHTLGTFGFTWVQGSLYVNSNEDMSNLFAAIMKLKSLAWLPRSIRDIRAFRVEQWSDFTKMVQGEIISTAVVD